MKKLIEKYLEGNCSQNEIEQIINYFKNSEEFSEVPEVDDLIDKFENLNGLESDKINQLHDSILSLISKGTPRIWGRKRKVLWKFSIAASILVLLGITVFLKNDSVSHSMQPVIENNKIVSGTDKAILKLADGSEVILSNNEEMQIQNATSNGSEIVYSNNNSKISKVEYNYLIIPRGGQYNITLSDGSQLWLNSETQIKYPANFKAGEDRIIELIYGEAYFKISPSTNHNGSKFKVINNKQDVEVLGTEFNIKAYKNESSVFTTLVEGKVKVSSKLSSEILRPNQQSIFSVENEKLSISEVNAKNEVAWMNGEFILKGKDLKEIMNVLSRWYDMNVIFENKDLQKIKFIGVLGKNQDIVEILNTIKSFGAISNYEINEKNVILK